MLIDHDQQKQEDFTNLLVAEHFKVLGVSAEDQVVSNMLSYSPDLVILDANLGFDNEAGFRVCKQLRQISNTLPIIFFTSRSSDIDKITGLRFGADDYITKDVSSDYLVAKIKSIVQRVEAFRSMPDEVSLKGSISLGQLILDLDAFNVTWRGRLVSLSLKQFLMLKALVESPGKVCPPDYLMDEAKIVVETNTIAAHIKNIRHQFQKIDPEFSCIKTERGVGYRWILM